MKTDFQTSGERYVSPEIDVIRVCFREGILSESNNTETIIPGGTVPGFDQNP
jgi:hypothetical protein